MHTYTYIHIYIFICIYIYFIPFFFRSPRARCLCYVTSPQSSRLSPPTLTLTPALSPHLLLGGPGGVAYVYSGGQVFIHT